jgi:hypothetical protein
MLMPVVASVHDEADVAVEEVEVVVVHVMAAGAAAEPHDVRSTKATNNRTNNRSRGRRLTAPLVSFFQLSILYSSGSILLLKI